MCTPRHVIFRVRSHSRSLSPSPLLLRHFLFDWIQLKKEKEISNSNAQKNETRLGMTEIKNDYRSIRAAAQSSRFGM